MKINENRLIADFMGVEWHKEFFKEVCIISPSNIHYKFHESWDWLMPVLERILDLSFQDNGDSEDFYNIRDCVPDINHTYQAIIEFIKNVKLKI